MKIVFTLVVAGVLMSCQSLKNHFDGPKTYRSSVVKTQRYRQANAQQQDLLYLDYLCANTVPYADSIFPPARRQHEVDSLMHLMATPVGELRFVLALKHYLTHYGNEHTCLYSGADLNKNLPLKMIRYRNQWHVLNITKPYDSLLIGQQVTALNGYPMDEVELRLSKYVEGENAISKWPMEANLMRFPEVLQSIGLQTQPDSLCFTFENERRVWVVAQTNDAKSEWYITNRQCLNEHPVTIPKPHFYDYSLHPDGNYAYLQFNKFSDQSVMEDGMNHTVPRWLLPLVRPLFYSMVRRHSKVFVNDIDFDRPRIKDYLRPMFDSIQQLGIDNLIIDLRNNPGGYPIVGIQLLYYLTDRSDLKDFGFYISSNEFQPQINKKRYQRFLQSYQSVHGTLPDSNEVFRFVPTNSDSLLFFKEVKNAKSPYYIPANRQVFKGKVYVLAGCSSHSSAAMLTTLMQDNHLATIIGTTVANNPTGPTFQNEYCLPNSKLVGSVAAGYLVRPDADRGKLLMPDFWVENGVADYFSYRDLLLEKALDLMAMPNSAFVPK